MRKVIFMILLTFPLLGIRSQAATIQGGFGVDFISENVTPVNNSLSNADAVLNSMNITVNDYGLKQVVTEEGQFTCAKVTNDSGCLFSLDTTIASLSLNKNEVEFSGKIAEELFNILPNITQNRVGVMIRGAANLQCSSPLTNPRLRTVTCTLTDVRAKKFNF